MANDKKSIKKYIDEKKELQKTVLQIIEKSETDDNDYHNLAVFLDSHEYEGNKSEVGHFLHLILSISNNHHRQQNFFEKIENILTIASKFFKPIFSNEEIFNIFQQNKPVLLLLLKTKIITIDEIIIKYLFRYSEINENVKYYYFYPELKEIIESKAIENINVEKYELAMDEDVENFKIKRQKFENDSKICSIIREDLIDDFIKYVNQTNISLTSQIKESIFETNLMLIEKEPSLIEYACFYGSIQIIKYIALKESELDPSLWLYAVHSDNPEVISFLEEKHVEMDDRTFSEAIKCHHNDIANYIYQNYFDHSTKIKNLSEESISSIYSSDNYEFFPYEMEGNMTFYGASKNGYNELVNYYLSLKKKDIEKYIRKKGIFNDKLIIKSLEKNKLDVAYHLLLEYKTIPERYFKNNKRITKIVLPPTIESILDNAFSGCTLLTEITIPSSVTSIGDDVFFGCSSLKEITIHSSINEIKQGFLASCPNLNKISIIQCHEKRIDYIENKCFIYKSNSINENFDTILWIKPTIDMITIPSFIRTIGSFAFLKCSRLTQITIPSSVTSIEEYAFNNCSSLTQVTFSNPSSIKSIGACAFGNCNSLTQITIPSSVTSIGYHTFMGCSSLKQISIPPTITIIGYATFYKCSSLAQITIPSSVNIIENGAFTGCSSLTDISIPSSVTYIGDSAFSQCSSLKHISIPSSITHVGQYPFYSCKSLTQVTIPSSILKQYFFSFPPKVQYIEP